jgi:hypothetical protein
MPNTVKVAANKNPIRPVTHATVMNTAEEMPKGQSNCGCPSPMMMPATATTATTSIGCFRSNSDHQRLDIFWGKG